MPGLGDGDSETLSFDIDQGTSYPFGSEGFRETWYVPKDPGTGRAPFYRHYSAPYQDHMDDPNASAAPTLGFVQEAVLGYPFTTSLEGTKPLTRYLNGGIFDHRTWLNSSAPPGYSVGSVFTNRRGYERFGNLTDLCSTQAAAAAIATSLQNSTMRVKFHPIWGNTIYELTHLPTGKQLVRPDIGMMIQMDLWYGGTDPDHQLNPTQAGGVDLQNYGAFRRRAGSPILSTSFSGGSPSTMTTEVKPLNFDHDVFVGNDVYTPLLWRGKFRATTTLGCKIKGSLMEDVLKRKHEVILDPDTTFNNSVNLDSTAWLDFADFGDCRNVNVKLETINLQTSVKTFQRYLDCSRPQWDIANPYLPQRKAIIITSADNSFALGFFNNGYPFTYYVGAGCSANNCSGLANQVLMLGSGSWKVPNRTSWVEDDVFYVLGAPAAVASRLVDIYNDGGDCIN
jgi:hypothetical protein